VEFTRRMDMDPFPGNPHPRREGGGHGAVQGLLASLCFHMLVAIAALGAANAVKTGPPPTVIDLALVPPAPPSALPQGPASNPRREPLATHRLRESVPGGVAGNPVLTGLPETDDTAAESASSQPTEPVPELTGLPAEGVPPIPGIAGLGGAADGPPVKAAAAREGSGLPLPVKERTASPGGAYGSIHSVIQRGIAYPALARKMGWEGRVVVAFRILPDGSVRDVRVVEGSGHAILDRNAVEAVRSASPFPLPPPAAEILTPVVYKLN